MPGRPRRHVIFERIINKNPGLDVAFPNKNFPQNGWPKRDYPKLTNTEELLFAKSIVYGLLKRISLLKASEAAVLAKSLPRLKEQFTEMLVLDDAKQASEYISTSLGRLSIPKLNHTIEPTPLELAYLAYGLLRKMPHKKDMKKRRSWVEKFGLDASDAAESDGTLIEHMLAHKYGISESRVHKILADAPK